MRLLTQMAMKINTRSSREFELVFESGTRLLALDKKFVAAEVQLPNKETHYLRTNSPLSQTDIRLVDVWLGSQPKQVLQVGQREFDIVINNEHNKR